MIKHYVFGNVNVLQSVYEYVNSNMFALISSNEALIIDPHKSLEITDLLNENRVKKITILLTHEHHDHTSGIYWYQEHFNTKLICQKSGAEWMASKRFLRPRLLNFILSEFDKENGTCRLDEFEKSFIARQYDVDISFDDELKINWQNFSIELYHIPGHSQGSSLILLDGKYAFTGDSLLKNIPIITRFPGSSSKDYEHITLPILNNKLKPNMILFPGHGDPFNINEIILGGKLYVKFR